MQQVLGNLFDNVDVPCSRASSSPRALKNILTYEFQLFTINTVSCLKMCHKQSEEESLSAFLLQPAIKKIGYSKICKPTFTPTYHYRQCDDNRFHAGAHSTLLTCNTSEERVATVLITICSFNQVRAERLGELSLLRSKEGKETHQKA
ncbi:hypothetical protein GOODEAATRI_015443 [Goodea atripinnis]|uniref:Uncharacterized protein n=1 Tax=Goodea atripinnis TaxID=208336 RepID=A0ABV0MI16_9TELE